ncbi:hypothetical protein M6B38_269455 [Iris pallida]|uniref:Uncharacterized protein n=1 Tax=Iris pallida TaxID=29817 RepID=A0AAX6I895_IRIPA|nr:hypothetical protein M6B38_269450 [Iris pallida]KAJ6849222.1 hypothetical protein M6B38_269455 [Iris pallida]
MGRGAEWLLMEANFDSDRIEGKLTWREVPLSGIERKDERKACVRSTINRRWSTTGSKERRFPLGNWLSK